MFQFSKETHFSYKITSLVSKKNLEKDSAKHWKAPSSTDPQIANPQSQKGHSDSGPRAPGAME